MSQYAIIIFNIVHISLEERVVIARLEVFVVRGGGGGGGCKGAWLFLLPQKSGGTFYPPYPNS